MKRVLLFFVLALFVACVPPDDALPLGSVAFNLKATILTTNGFYISQNGWSVKVNRSLLALQTSTIGQTGADNKCSYRGRGAMRDAVFDPVVGIVQTFNGIEPTECPDVGFILAAPTSVTIPGPGATSDDLLMLAAGEPAHAYVDMTATRENFGEKESYDVRLRFETSRTVSRFGGCRAASKGVRVLPNHRIELPIAFSADAFFRESLGGNATLRFEPFADADADGDHVITLDELDQIPLNRLTQYSDAYVRENGSRSGTFGDFVRLQLKFAFIYRVDGVCVGTDEP